MADIIFIVKNLLYHLPYGITQCYLPPDTSKRATPNPSHAGWYSIYLPRRDRRLSWPSLLDSAPAGSRTSDLSITSPTPNRCTTKTTNSIRYSANTRTTNYSVGTTLESSDYCTDRRRRCGSRPNKSCRCRTLWRYARRLQISRSDRSPTWYKYIQGSLRTIYLTMSVAAKVVPFYIQTQNLLF